MNSVEASDLIRDQLDAYGVNFSIEFKPKPNSGVCFSGREVSDLPLWEIVQSGVICEVWFERLINGSPAQVHLRYLGQTPETVSSQIIEDVRSNLTPREVKPC